MIAPRIACLALGAFGAFGAPAVAHADPIVSREAQSFDPVTREVFVTLTFDTAPDLVTPGGDAFAYLIGFRPFPDILSRSDLAIRTETAFPGLMVARYGDAYPATIRGTIAGTIPYSVDTLGTTVSFVVPGSFAAPPIFLPPRARYTLVTFAGGTTSNGPDNPPIVGEWGFGPVVPEPGTLGMMAAGVALALALMRRRPAGRR
jgi:hypothetical protein